MKSFIADHSNRPKGGTRREDEQNAVDAVLLSAVWNVDSSERVGRQLLRALDFRKETIMQSQQLASGMKERDERFSVIKRKIRRENVQESVYTYIRKWQHNDQNMRIDTNTWKEKSL
jgi:hypothetical protein